MTSRSVNKLIAYCEAQLKQKHSDHLEYNESVPQSFVNSNENFILYEDTGVHDILLEKGDKPGWSVEKKIKCATDPKISSQKLNSIKSFTSIYQDSTAITWAQITANSDGKWKNGVTISNWKYFSIPPSADGSDNICKLSKKIVHIINQMPETDIYVVENNVKANQFRKTITGKFISGVVQMNQINAILVTLLQSRNKCSDSEWNVFLMGHTAMARLYNLYVGQEAVSTQSIIKKIFHANPEQLDNHTKHDDHDVSIEIDDTLKKVYFDAKNVDREFLGKSLLIGLTFIRCRLLKVNK